MSNLNLDKLMELEALLDIHKQKAVEFTNKIESLTKQNEELENRLEELTKEYNWFKLFHSKHK